MLSDLHSYVYGGDQLPLLQRVADEKPDLILLCGDIIDDKKPQSGAMLLLAGIVELAPCYYVSGNHEYWSGDPQGIFSLVESYGIRVLRNEWENVQIGTADIIICGADDPARYGGRTPKTYGNDVIYRRMLARFDRVQTDRFRILLAHRPEYMEEYASHAFDLALCGHAHGGQWRIPYVLNGLIAPNQGFFPAYAGGRYDLDGMVGIVGRGLMLDWKPRLFNPPEIVTVDIEGMA